MSKKKYTIVSFFAGVGGIEYGFEKTRGFKTIWANEIDSNASKTYKLNFKHELVVKDVHNIRVEDVPKADILIGGFPCQAFSIAGYRKGFDDDRGNLFFELIRIIEVNEPRVVFLENVRNLVSHDGGNTYRIIKQALEAHGYTVRKDVLNAKDYGNIPQNRERIYIVAFKNPIDAFHYEELTTIPLKKTVSDMLDASTDSKYHYTADKTLIYDKIIDHIDEENVAYQWRRQYVRKNKSGVFPTLTANMGMGGHNVPIVYQGGIIRKLTPRECFRVQGYDENFKLPKDIADSQLYKQAGNSVVVPVISRLAESIHKALSSTDKS